MPKFPVAEARELNAVVRPRLEALYGDAGSFFSARGQKIVERGVAKGTVAGETGMYRFFEPAILLALSEETDVLYGTAVVAKSIPFIGDYTLWTAAGSVIAGAFRVLTLRSDPRTDEVAEWLSIPQNGGVPGPIVINKAMTNRLNGRLLEHYLRKGADYRVPLTLPQLSSVIVRISELSVMWAFGGSDVWPRPRIDEELEAARQLLAEFLA